MDERLLNHLWRSQTFDRGVLPRAGGGTVQIVYPGRPNPHEGPDFVDAMVALDSGELLSGEVELHVHRGDWRAHGHQRDPRYNSVILHVVWEDDGSQIVRQDGTPLPTAVLGGLPQSAQWETGKVSFMSPPSPDPCRRTSTALGPDVLGETLDRAGEERFLAKATVLEGELSCHAAEEVLYIGMMESLGYSRNQSPFRQLAMSLPLSALCGFAAGKREPERILTALLLGAAGLLQPAQERLPAGGERGVLRSLKLEADQTDRTNWTDRSDPSDRPDGEGALQEIWERSELQPLLPPSSWQQARVRPENLPARRLVGMAYLLARNLPVGLLESMLSVLRGGSARAPLLLRRFCQVCSQGYCPSHLRLGREPAGAAPALIGTGRAAEMVVNVLLPFAWALGQHRGDDLLCQRAMDIYRRHAATESNHVTRQMSEQLWGDRRGAFARSARRHQGLLHLFHLYCRRRRCRECPAAQESVVSAG